MFKGIVEAIGTITQIDSKDQCVHLTIQTTENWQDLMIGDSVAVNGVCLTITHLGFCIFDVTVVPETLRVTNLGLLHEGQSVNLERSIKVDSRIDGHYVQGHVDGVGEIIDLKTDGKAALLATIQVSPLLAKYIVKKGYIALDGMSITVIDIANDWFTVTFIPHTQQVTICHQYQKGKKVNIEIDILSKYVEKLLGDRASCNLT